MSLAKRVFNLETDRATVLGGFRRGLEHLRQIDPEVPSQTLVLLLLVAVKGSMTMPEIAKALDMSSSAVTRNVFSLTKNGLYGKKGFPLLESFESPEDRRYRVVELTPHGRRMIDTLVAVLT
jgi:DNA-binding MarR family transcriptional regulator